MLLCVKLWGTSLSAARNVRTSSPGRRVDRAQGDRDKHRADRGVLPIELHNCVSCSEPHGQGAKERSRGEARDRRITTDCFGEIGRPGMSALPSMDLIRAILSGEDSMPKQRYQEPTLQRSVNGSWFIRPWVDRIGKDGSPERSKKTIVLGGADMGKREC